MAHKFDPSRAEILEDEARQQWQDVDAVLEAGGIQEGLVCVDLGCGTGYFTLPLAKRVGPTGKVHALDVSPQMLGLLQEKLQAGNLPQVQASIVSEPLQLQLPEGSVDVVLVANTYHEFEDRKGSLTEILRVLKPSVGRLLLTDWKKIPKGEGEPGPSAVERVSQIEARKELREVGYGRIVDAWEGKYHYQLAAWAPSRRKREPERPRPPREAPPPPPAEEPTPSPAPTDA